MEEDGEEEPAQEEPAQPGAAPDNDGGARVSLLSAHRQDRCSSTTLLHDA
jgi:hypothetical protein